MPYSNYEAPGVDVLIERRNVEQRSVETEFYPVFIGTGITSRNRNIEKNKIRADISAFPKVKLEFSLMGDINTDLFDKTVFTVGQVAVTYSSPAEGSPSQVVLEPTTGYRVVDNIKLSTYDSTASVVLEILDTTVTSNDVIYDIDLTASNVDRDFDLRLVGAEDRFFSKDLFGPIVLKENDREFFNDIAIAAEIAFRMEVPRFYYLEVPRDYGSLPTPAEFKAAIEKVYFANNAYRVVALTSEPEVISAVNQFVSGVSNPIDRRETVGFVTRDTSDIIDMQDINELIDKIGGQSVALNNKRCVNIFCGNSVDLRINNQVYVLPEYFMAVAVASLDAVVGKVDPLSLREINVFENIDGPRFRPRMWDLLAKWGVFIVSKETADSPAIIRHQLTSAQSDIASDQEYSVVKNWDVVTKKIRDRFKPYAGQNNVDAGYTERLEGTLATVRQEILEEKLARSLEVITPWQQREGSDGRNLVTRMKMDAVYPANNLDIYLIV